MPATDTLEDEILSLIFENLDFANIGDATGIQGSSAPGNVEITLHTATLSDTSTQASSEAAYTSYARLSVARSSAQWTTSSGNATNDALLSFPQATGGSETEVDFGIGSAVAANDLWIYGALSASLAVSNGITPEFAIGDIDITVT